MDQEVARTLEALPDTRLAAMACSVLPKSSSELN